MISRILAAAAWAASLAALAAPVHEMPSRAFTAQKSSAPAQFRLPALRASLKVSLPEMTAAEKSLASTGTRSNEPLRIGTVRALAKSAPIDSWTPADGGFVTHVQADSDGALGLRVKLELANVAAPIEIRAQGNDGRVVSMLADPAKANEAWTPWTEGSEQMIEVFSPSALDPGAVRVVSIVHFTDSPFAKAASSCTISTACSTGDPALDGAMLERKKSVARMHFVDGSSAYLCTGTLINTERFPAPYFMTAHHCVNNQAAATSLETYWFYEDSTCGSNIPSTGSEQIAGGAELVMTNYNLDSTLLLLNTPPPSGTVFSGWDNTEILPASPTFNISHPKGDTSRWASGFFTGADGRIDGPVQQFNISSTARGFIEGGSSGSGLFTLANGSLKLRGTLLGTYLDYACGAAEGNVIYSRFDIFEPQIDQYIRTALQAPDDAPNRARDFFNTGFADPNGIDKPLNERTDTLALDNRRIDYVGDIDVYRFRVTAPSWVSVWTEGAQDTVGSILDSRGVNMESNDDWQVGAPYNMGITKFLPAGTYYAQVGHFEPTGTGAYNLRMRADMVDTNYTALWWNANESGWGLNINHQGNVLFGTLYTYDASGNATWFSMSNGAKQADGSYQGDLVRSTGPVFSASPWNPNAVGRSVVGTMRISFTDDNNGTLTYNVGSAQVTKSITRLNFKTPPTCAWSASNRSYATNFTDLWWGGAAESGWGVNLVHQSNVIFATLFTYDASGQPLWLVMSDGEGVPGSRTYTGILYRTTGPAFNAVPFTPITAANNTQVGTMTLKFDATSGNAATMTYTVNGTTVTKSIQRLEIAAIKPQCTQATP